MAFSKHYDYWVTNFPGLKRQATKETKLNQRQSNVCEHKFQRMFQRYYPDYPVFVMVAMVTVSNCLLSNPEPNENSNNLAKCVKRKTSSLCEMTRKHYAEVR